MQRLSGLTSRSLCKVYLISEYFFFSIKESSEWTKETFETHIVANINGRSVVAVHSLADVSLDLADARYDREVIYDHVESPNLCSLPVPASDRIQMVCHCIFFSQPIPCKSDQFGAALAGYLAWSLAAHESWLNFARIRILYIWRRSGTGKINVIRGDLRIFEAKMREDVVEIVGDIDLCAIHNTSPLCKISAVI